MKTEMILQNFEKRIRSHISIITPNIGGQGSCGVISFCDSCEAEARNGNFCVEIKGGFSIQFNSYENQVAQNVQNCLQDSCSENQWSLCEDDVQFLPDDQSRSCRQSRSNH